MVYIIVGILKWIGIVLLALLAFLLFILLLVLFLPIRYRVQAEYREKLNGDGWVRWMYPMLELRLQIEDNRPKTQIRIFGRSPEAWKKSVGKGRGRKRKKAEHHQKTEEHQKKENCQKTEILQEIENSPKREAQSTEVLQEAENAPKTEPQETVPEAEHLQETENCQKDKENDRSLSRWERIVQAVKSFFAAIRKRILGIWNRLRAIGESIKGVWQKLSALWEKVGSLWGKWEQIQKLLYEDSTKRALALIWKECKKLFFALKPKKYSFWLHYGTGDAYTLAQHLRVLAVVYGLCGEHVVIEPDWEQKVLLAKGSVKGRIRIFTLARICIKVITDKNVKRLWKQVSEWERSQKDGRK